MLSYIVWKHLDVIFLSFLVAKMKESMC